MAKGRSEKTGSRLPDAKERSALLEWSLSNPLIRLILLVCLVASLVSLLAPYRFNETLPVKGTVAQRNYYASHDFQVDRPNPEYEEMVRRVESRVPPAYSYQAELGQELLHFFEADFRRRGRSLRSTHENSNPWGQSRQGPGGTRGLNGNRRRERTGGCQSGRGCSPPRRTTGATELIGGETQGGLG